MYKDLPIDLAALKKLYSEELHQDPERAHQLMLQFYERMAEDPMLGFFFTGRDLIAVARKQTEFFLKQAGGAPSFSGKPPAQAHFHLPPILPGHFDRRLKILEQTLLENKITQPGREAWLGFENAFRSVIVRD